MIDGQLRIGDPELYKKVASDRDVDLILRSTLDGAKSASEIILDSNIAPSTAYRKLKKLASMNLLQIEYIMGERGRWETKYRSNLGVMRLDCDGKF